MVNKDYHIIGNACYAHYSFGKKFASFNECYNNSTVMLADVTDWKKQ